VRQINPDRWGSPPPLTPDDTTSVLGEWFLKERERLGVDRVSLGGLLWVNPSRLTRLETGTSLLDASALAWAFRVFGTPPEEQLRLLDALAAEYEGRILRAKDGHDDQADPARSG
jgi:transcriptional regulator with XRE-family HTH domain